MILMSSRPIHTPSGRRPTGAASRHVPLRALRARSLHSAPYGRPPQRPPHAPRPTGAPRETAHDARSAPYGRGAPCHRLGRLLLVLGLAVLGAGRSLQSLPPRHVAGVDTAADPAVGHAVDVAGCGRGCRRPCGGRRPCGRRAGLLDDLVQLGFVLGFLFVCRSICSYVHLWERHSPRPAPYGRGVSCGAASALRSH